MAQQEIDIGSVAGDGSGDPLRDAFNKINQNFTELYSGNVQVTAANIRVYSVAGRTGNIVLTVNDVAQAASKSYVNTSIQSNVSVLNQNILDLSANVEIIQANNIAIASNLIAAYALFAPKNNPTFNQSITIQNGLQTVDVDTGALVIPGLGGASVGGNINVGQGLFVGAQAQTSDISQAIAVFRGTSGTGPLTQYTHIAVGNQTNTGSADIAVYADNGNDLGGWTDMGIAGTQFNDPGYTITSPNDGYLFTHAGSNGLGGNLVLATSETGSFKDLIFGVGGFHSNAIVAKFHGNATTGGYFAVVTGTNSTNSSDGAVRVLGGVGISQDLHLAGNLYGNLSYTMSNPSDWNSPVTTVQQALDQLAARLKGLNG